jgi:hypothetical protein
MELPTGRRLTVRRLNLSRQTGNDPCLVGLLRVFKDYYPEIIVGEAVRGKASAFKVRRPSPARHTHVSNPHSTPTPRGARGSTRSRKPTSSAQRTAPRLPTTASESTGP